MINQDIAPGDLFIVPGGNVRFGGLVLEVGIVLSATEKRLKTLITRFDKPKVKPTNKTPSKLLKVLPNNQYLDQEAVKFLLKHYNQFIQTQQHNECQKENVHLIAAAPELLEALEKMLQRYGYETCEYVQLATAAIAKAKGE